MNSLLGALYDLLSFITEDASAHGLAKHVPPHLMEAMNTLCIELGEYLDEQERLDLENQP
jgi:hypothetical protein